MSPFAQSLELPVLPLRDVVVFPHMVVPLFVGREKSVAALEAAFARPNNDILIVTQVNARTNDPGKDDLYDIACVGAVKNIMRLPDGTVKVLVEGRKRARIAQFVDGHVYLCAKVVPHEATDSPEPTAGDAETQRQDLRAAFEAYVKVNRRIPPEILISVTAIDDASQLVDTIAAHVNLKLPDRQVLLTEAAPYARLAKLKELLEAETETVAAETPGKKAPQGRQQQAQGEGNSEADEFKQELEDLSKQIADKGLPEEAKDKMEREFKKLKMMNPMSAEAGVARTYIEWVLSLPWKNHSQDKLDVVEARAVLDADHYGLDKPKERIVEYLAVQQLRGEIGKGPVLCLVGPPGVGKTSLAKSVAKALGRKFVRISLGGVRDEAEIRGHRRTYVGALPGKIIAALKRAGTSNPVLLLDEIDKMSQDFRGDPASALLEVLDPEQHHAFVDHYIDLDYDLTKVLFITTANNLPNIPWPLQDRLEILELGGYTEVDKLQIAKQYLIGRQLEETGLAKVAEVKMTDEGIQTVIRSYTREAGVRSLERQLGAVLRKLGTQHLTAKADKKKTSYKITGKQVIELLGPQRFKRNDAEGQDRVGVTNGLAVTATGGDLLLVEVALVPGKGKMTVTGKLGDVMKESVEAAMTYVRSRAHLVGLNRDFASKIDVHVHFPEGATPKDGPSAGIAIATALVSALTQIPVRHDVAMTGEITLRGRVLPIGGLKEKIIAAHRAGVTRVLIPRENERDLPEIPKDVLKDLEVVLVDHADMVLQSALRLDDPKSFLANPTLLSRDDLGLHDTPVATTH